MTIRVFVVDFETQSACDLRRSGTYRYARDPSTRVLCLSVRRPDLTKFTWFPHDHPGASPELLELVCDPDVIWSAHNCAFERNIWKWQMEAKFGFASLPAHRWHDTMAVAAYKALPQGLDSLARVLNMQNQKDTEGSRLTLSLSKVGKDGKLPEITPEILERVGAYCEGDVAAQGEITDYLGPLPPAERRVWLLDQRINDRGIRIDLAYVRACQKIVDEASIPLAAEFASLTGGLRAGQRDKFLGWLSGNGVELPNLAKDTVKKALAQEDENGTDEELSEDPLAQEETCAPGTLPSHVRRALSIRALVGSASLKKLAAMEACVCTDGRARGLLVYHGTSPGRWAARLLQPQNFPRGVLEWGKTAAATKVDSLVSALMTGDYEYVEAIFGPAIEAVVSGLRHAIVSSRDRTLLSGDYAGIQARIVLALAGQHDKTAIMAAGQDIYCDMAVQIYQRPINKKEDPAERQVGKNSVLGLGFQMGAQTFHEKYGEGHPLEFMADVVRIYRTEWAPCVPQLWYSLEAAAVRAVHERTPQEAFGIVYQLEDGWLSCRLPSGRKIWYRDPRPTYRAMPWDKTDIRPGFSFSTWKMGRWVQRHAFGGLLTENVVMGIERDIMVGGMFRAEKNGIPVVLTVHDEIVGEPKTVDADPKAFEQILCDVEPWVQELRVPIAVECWQGERYRK